jgi:hypothetical protein
MKPSRKTAFIRYFDEVERAELTVVGTRRHAFYIICPLPPRAPCPSSLALGCDTDGFDNWFLQRIEF